MFPQPQILEPECQAIYQEYIEASASLFRLFSPLLLAVQSGQYWKDTETAIAAGKPLLEEAGNFTKMIVFDIDETCLSNIPLFQMTQSSITPEQWRQWVASARAPAIPVSLEFYKVLPQDLHLFLSSLSQKELHAKGFSVVFLTGRPESVRNVTITNLYRAGFGSKCSE